MKLSKFLLISTAVAFFALLYVWQQTEVFRLAYTGQKHLIAFQDLLDKNTILRYNINKDTSLIRINNKVAKLADFQMPDNYRLVKLTLPAQGLRVSKGVSRKENIVSRLFSIKRQAEAKTINP